MSAVPDTTAADNSIRIRLQLARADFTLDVDLALADKSITVLFGPSGSGKTTLLRCVAGLERAPGARISVGAAVWQDEAAAVFVPTWQRALGYVFQEASLFAHLDVRANLEYGLRRVARTTRPAAAPPMRSDPRLPVQPLQAAITLEAAIELLGLQTLLQRRPEQLSGGERQRVAIARALCAQPRLLLLDEPLASLDQARREDILPWLERLREQLHLPMLYVTHSADEVARLADTLVLLERGRVRQAGPVAQVLAQLDTPVTLGDDVGALLQGQMVARDAQWHLAQVAFEGGTLWLRDSQHALGTPVRLRILARDVSITLEMPQHTSIQNLLPCVIDALQPDAHPSQTLVRLRCGAALVLARITARSVAALQLRVGQRVWAQVKAVALVG
jgi:molybdate transport system ATP-binding protein